MIGDQDMSHFFNPEEFGEMVKLNGIDQCVIFDDAYEVAGAGMGMSSSVPAITIASNLVPENVTGMAVVARGKKYEVAEPQPDGTGITVLILEEA